MIHEPTGMTYAELALHGETPFDAYMRALHIESHDWEELSEGETISCHGKRTVHIDNRNFITVVNHGSAYEARRVYDGSCIESMLNELVSYVGYEYDYHDQIAELVDTIANMVYASDDVIHVCDNMSYSRSLGLIVVSVDGGGVDSIYELHQDGPDPTDLWHVVEDADRSPDYNDMHPSAHWCIWQYN